MPKTRYKIHQTESSIGSTTEQFFSFTVTEVGTTRQVAHATVTYVDAENADYKFANKARIEFECDAVAISVGEFALYAAVFAAIDAENDPEEEFANNGLDRGDIEFEV